VSERYLEARHDLAIAVRHRRGSWVAIRDHPGGQALAVPRLLELQQQLYLV